MMLPQFNLYYDMLSCTCLLNSGLFIGYFDQIAKGYEKASLARPWSWLRAREYTALLEVSKNILGCKALDLGSGAGYYTRVLLETGASHVTAVDASENMITALGNDARILGVVSKA